MACPSFSSRNGPKRHSSALPPQPAIQLLASDAGDVPDALVGVEAAVTADLKYQARRALHNEDRSRSDIK